MKYTQLPRPFSAEKKTVTCFTYFISSAARIAATPTASSLNSADGMLRVARLSCFEIAVSYIYCAEIKK